MALIHNADLRPSKLDVLRTWTAAQPWFAGETAALERIGAYRFDDPDGEVGVEIHLVRAGEVTLHIPLTYRGSPFPAGTLAATMDHSVLGPRWVYDATTDPVFVRTLSTAIWTGGHEAEFEFAGGAHAGMVAAMVLVQGSGTPGTAVPDPAVTQRALDRATTVLTGPGQRIVVRHVLDPIGEPDAGVVLRGTWPGQDEPVVLATAVVV